MPAAQVLAQPLAVSEAWLNAARRQLASLTPEALLAYEGKPLEGSHGVQVRDGVSVIAINGPLFKQPNIWTFFFGGNSYEALRRDIETCANDDSIRAIVFNIDSPGGEVYGCNELSDAVFALRGKKPLIAYAGGQCDSGAYWIASACDEIIANATSELGSIGVRTMLIDDSKRDEAQGIKEYNIVASQSPLKVVDPSSAPDRARVQAQMTAYADVFVSDVAKGRGVSKSKVLEQFGQGDVFVGQKAVDRGLADRLGTLESVIEKYAVEPGFNTSVKAKKKGKTMADKNPAAPKAKMSDASCSGCDRDMDDDDDLYCAACYGADADAKALCALLGVPDMKQAIGVIVSLKEKSTAAEALQKEIAALKVSAEQAEIKALIDAAVLDGRVKQPKRAQMESLAAEHGLPALKACLANLIPSAAPAIPASDQAAKAAAAKSEAPTSEKPESTFGLTATEQKIARATGITFEKFAEGKARMEHIRNPSEEEQN